MYRYTCMYDSFSRSIYAVCMSIVMSNGSNLPSVFPPSDVQTSPTSSSFNAPVEIATGATAMAVSHSDSLKPITVESSSAIPSFSFWSGMHGQMQASLQPGQGQVMQQQPTEAQIKHANLERILTALERAQTPQQQQEMFAKVRATPEQQQQLLNRVHARRQKRLQQQQEQKHLQQGIHGPGQGQNGIEVLLIVLRISTVLFHELFCVHVKTLSYKQRHCHEYRCTFSMLSSKNPCF